MLSHGYIISNLARNERFCEAELLLDKLLKGYTKDSALFEDDGSRTQRYYREDVSGMHEVILKKNITESHIAVYSDKPMKIFRFGGWVFYIRDIIPTVIFALFYIIFATRYNHDTMWGQQSFEMLSVFIFGTLVPAVINFVTQFFLKKNRSLSRIRFIQCGGIISFIYIFVMMLRFSGRGSIWSFWFMVFCYSPFIEVVGGLVLTNFIGMFIRRE